MAHHHVHAGNDNERRTSLAALIIGSFMLVEVVGGLWSGSLALLADAGHMLTDFASLSMAWLAFRLGRRPADWQRAYGFDRFQVLVAFVTGTYHHRRSGTRSLRRPHPSYCDILLGTVPYPQFKADINHPLWQR